MSLAPHSGAAGEHPLVRLERVNKFFGPQHVLIDIDLSVYAGEVVVVIGPSGSGKSTLCRCINRLEPIDSGALCGAAAPGPVHRRDLPGLDPAGAPRRGGYLSLRERCPVPDRSRPWSATAQLRRDARTQTGPVAAVSWPATPSPSLPQCVRPCRAKSLAWQRSRGWSW